MAEGRVCLASIEGRQIRRKPFGHREMQGVAGPQRPGTIHQLCRGAKVAGLDFRRAERGRREAMEEQEGLPAGRGIDAAHALFDGPDAGHLGEGPGRRVQAEITRSRCLAASIWDRTRAAVGSRKKMAARTELSR